MQILQAKHREQILKLFKDIKEPVTIVNFSQEFECQFCRETRTIAQEVSALSDKIAFVPFDFAADLAEVRKYGIEQIPATVVMGDKDYGIRFYGVPFGYELAAFLQAIVHVSKRDSQLSPATKQALKSLNNDVRLKVFGTLTCPYCPMAVALAHRMAIESEHISADMIEAQEFPHLARKYNVMGVPRTIINETEAIEGAVSEQVLLQKILSNDRASTP